MNFESIKDMEKENKDLNQKSTPLKVAELATFLYAVLVFMSLILDNAYYAQFNIPIVSYMSGSEILLSCVQQLITPTSLVYAILILCSFVMMPIVYRMVKDKPYLEGETAPSHDDTTATYNTASAIILLVSLISGLFIHFGFFDGVMFVMLFATIFYVYLIFPNPIPKKSLFKRVCDIAASNVLRQHKERLYDINYRYRIHIFVLACLLSMFFVLLKMQYRKAEDVREKGAGVCVILEGDGINIDTREGTIDYIGECAGNIFLYDRDTQGTIIYERSQIRHYKLITDYIAKANVKYDRYAEHVQSENRHIGTNLLERINAEAPLTDVFTFTLPDNYVLTLQENNYFVWEDTLTHSYIEQLNLPKRLFENMPAATDIFNLDIYVAEGRDRTENHGLCATTFKKFTGKGGELVQTIVGDGDHYTAWLFYDPTGQHTDIMTDLHKSMSLKGNVWQQMAIIYQANKTPWMIVLIVLCITFLICFLIGCFFNSSEDKQPANEEESKPEKKKTSTFLGVSIFSLLSLVYFWGPLIFFARSYHRWAVILTFVGLTILTMIVLFFLGMFISAFTTKPTPKND